MNTCVDSTVLRSHLDHPDAELEAHLDDCEVCQRLLRSVAEDAGYAGSRLALLASDDGEPVDVDAALDAVCARIPPEPVSVLAERPRRRDRTALRRLALAAAGVIVLALFAVSPVGRVAIAATLDAFRGERLEPVTVGLDDWANAPVFEGIRALDVLGEVDLSDLQEPERVADVDAGAGLAGVDAPRLPDPADRVVAMAPGTIRVVLNSEAGNDVPAELDGAALIVDVPGALAAMYGPVDGPPHLVIGRTGQVVVRAEGAPLEDIREFLLGHGELPADLRAQLAGIEDWRSTIPVPVPLDGPGWEEVTVAGRDALAFGDDSGLLALVLRQDPTGVTVVGGHVTVTKAIELAEDA